MGNCSFYDVPCWLGWLIAEIKALCIWLLEAVFNALLAVLNLLPVPDFFNDLGTFQIPDSVMYFADAFALPEGVAMIVSAYTFRFILRRIPGIG